MKDEIHTYFDTLGGLLAKIEVTDGNTGCFSLAEGVEKAIDLIMAQTAAGNKIIFIGNGGSSSIASHQAIDFWKNGHMRAMAFNDAALLTCVSNDFGYQHVFEKPLEIFAASGDVLVAISSSGSSENILRGAEAAKKKGCHVITMSGFKNDNSLRTSGELNFYTPARSYGYVEISHLSLCHGILDLIMEKKVR